MTTVEAMNIAFHEGGKNYKEVCENMIQERLSEEEKDKFQKILNDAQMYFEKNEEELFMKYIS